MFRLIVLLLLLSACGFEVLYKDHQNSESIAYQLASIRIQKKRNKFDWQLQNNLYELFNPDKIPSPEKYLLIVDTDQSISSTYITSTGASGRNKITITANYVLKNLNTDQQIASGNVVASDNYDVSANRFATFVSEDYFKSNILKIIANDIRNSVVNDFSYNKKMCQDQNFNCPL
jgi:hypothetical protein